MTHHFPRNTKHTHAWRAGLDATANCAVIVTAVSLIISFSQPSMHHGLIVLNALFVSLFVVIEAARYCDYQWWNCRLRLLETDVFAEMLVPPFHPLSKWRESLIDNVLHFNPPISLWEAIGLRLRRHYLWLLLITVIAWFTKYWLFPTRAVSFTQFVRRAAIGPIPGSIVIGFSLAVFGALLLIVIFTSGITKVRGDTRIYTSDDDVPEKRTHRKHPYQRGNQTRTWLASRHLFLVWIVTSKMDAVAKGILHDIGCDVTAVPGKESTLLICTLTALEINSLRGIVVREDPHATVHVLGKGVDPISED